MMFLFEKAHKSADISFFFSCYMPNLYFENSSLQKIVLQRRSSLAADLQFLP